MNRDGWRPYKLNPGDRVIRSGVLMTEGDDGKLVPASPEDQKAYLDDIAGWIVSE